MNKLITAFMLFFLINVMLSAIMEGGGGTTTTRLTADLATAGVTLNVVSTEGFLESDYVIIGQEKIRYSSTTANTFVVAAGGRGYDGTDATTHGAGAKVYSPESSVLNAALGFNIASTGATVGAIDMFVATKAFFFTTMPKLITWDFAHFRYSEWGQLLRYVFLAISTGFMVYMTWNILSALGGVAQSIFVRP